jgi:3-dehydroquinate synthase
MSSHAVTTRTQTYRAIVERGILRRTAEFIPPRTGKVFVLTTSDVWEFHGAKLAGRFPHVVLFHPGGEPNKRLSVIEDLAEQMAAAGADRSSLVIAFGGGIVNDGGGFLAAIFMRGIPVIQIPTTLLAQVDAAVGGKTGVNLVSGKNLIGAFHQPLAVLIDPDVLATLPEREYRAGLFEIVKAGIIRSPELFELMANRSHDVLARQPGVVDRIIDESVKIKAEVVTADERESDLRKILNFGHTIGHALEAETKYERFLHGEAVCFGMEAAVRLAQLTGMLGAADAERMIHTFRLYGPIPSLDGIEAGNLFGRLVKDKKTIQGTVHFVLPDRIGNVKVVTGIADAIVLEAIGMALG